MKRGRFTETQIVSILKEADAGGMVKDICRQHILKQTTDGKNSTSTRLRCQAVASARSLEGPLVDVTKSQKLETTLTRVTKSHWSRQ